MGIRRFNDPNTGRWAPVLTHISAVLGTDGKSLKTILEEIRDGKIYFDNLTPEQQALLKGEKGDDGQDGQDGATGPQGATGVYDSTTQNFLTTLETTIGQDQTKTMTQKAITDELIITQKKLYEWQNLSVGTLQDFMMASNGNWWWNNTSGSETYHKQKHSVIEVTPGEMLLISCDISSVYGFLTSTYDTATRTSGSSIPFSTEASGRINYDPTDGEIAIVIPQDAKYLCLNRVDSSLNTPKWKVQRRDKSKSILDTKTGDSEIMGMTQKAITDALTYGVIDIPLTAANAIKTNLYDNANVGTWASANSTQYGYIFPVIPGALYKWTLGDHSTRAVWLQSDQIQAGDPVVNPEWWTLENKGDTAIVQAPSDAHFIYFRMHNTDSYAPASWGILQSVKERVAEMGVLEQSLGQNTAKSMSQKAVTDELIEVEKKFGVFGDDMGGSLALKNCCIDAAYGNKWRWRTSTTSAYKQKHSVISVQPGDVFMLKASGDVANGQYVWLNEDYDPDSVYVNDDSIPIVEGTAISYEAAGVEFYVVAPAGAAYLCLNRSSYTAKTSDWKVRKLESMADAVDDAKKVKELIANAKYVHRATEAHTKSLGLLHYTDIHGDDDAVAQIKKWMDKYGDYINDVLNTGDMVKSNAEDTAYSWEWWHDCGLAEMSLSMIGNHDGAYKTTYKATSDYDEKNGNTNWFWNGEGKEWDFEKYIAPYAEGWGVTMPDGYDDPTSPNYKACYYHKDYTEQKIRLIVLDCMHRFDGIVDPETGQASEGSVGVKKENLTTEQEEWLVARLNETLTDGNAVKGYSVVVACHYPLDDYTNFNAKPWSERSHDYTDFNRNADGGVVMDYKTGESSNWQYMQEFPPFNMASHFCLRNHTGFDSQGFPVKGNVNNFGNIIDEFINGGGKFVVWLSGHVHCDMLYYPDNYPNILVCANTMAGQGNGTDREDRQVSGVAANYVAIDTDNGLFKMVRLGLSTNKYLTPKNYICYDYINKKIVSEG